MPSNWDDYMLPSIADWILAILEWLFLTWFLGGNGQGRYGQMKSSWKNLMDAASIRPDLVSRWRMCLNGLTLADKANNMRSGTCWWRSMAWCDAGQAIPEGDKTPWNYRHLRLRCTGLISGGRIPSYAISSVWIDSRYSRSIERDIFTKNQSTSTSTSDFLWKRPWKLSSSQLRGTPLRWLAPCSSTWWEMLITIMTSKVRIYMKCPLHMILIS